MINKNMFFTEPTIKDYRDMKLDEVLKEFLLFKGTKDGGNKKVNIKDLISSALFVYGLKSNVTNKKAIEYYLEKEARQRLIIENNTIVVPSILWDEWAKRNLCKEIKDESGGEMAYFSEKAVRDLLREEYEQANNLIRFASRCEKPIITDLIEVEKSINSAIKKMKESTEGG